MKKTRNANGITIEYESRIKFKNILAAIKAAQIVERDIALQNYLVATVIDSTIDMVKVTVHFNGMSIPKMRHFYPYTKKTITSHEFYNKYEKKVMRVRCVDYRFEYEK